MNMENLFLEPTGGNDLQPGGARKPSVPIPSELVARAVNNKSNTRFVRRRHRMIVQNISGFSKGKRDRSH